MKATWRGTLRGVAKALGVTEYRVRKLKAAGVDLGDEEAVREALDPKRRRKRSQKPPPNKGWAGMTNRKRAEMLGTTPEWFSRAKAAGVDVADYRAVIAYRDSRSGGFRAGGESEDIEAAKKRKLDLECQKLEIAIEQLQGRLVPLEEVEEERYRAGLATRMQVERLPDLLPPKLEGLTAAQMKKKLTNICREVLEELSRTEYERVE